jgi:hypothetical protein
MNRDQPGLYSEAVSKNQNNNKIELNENENTTYQNVGAMLGTSLYSYPSLN